MLNFLVRLIFVIVPTFLETAVILKLSRSNLIYTVIKGRERRLETHHSFYVSGKRGRQRKLDVVRDDRENRGTRWPNHCQFHCQYLFVCAPLSRWAYSTSWEDGHGFGRHDGIFARALQNISIMSLTGRRLCIYSGQLQDETHDGSSSV